MSEKVFGLTKEIMECQLEKYEVNNLIEDSVPVVSVEWLEKWCRKNQTDYLDYISSNDLLVAVKKEAKK